MRILDTIEEAETAASFIAGRGRDDLPAVVALLRASVEEED